MLLKNTFRCCGLLLALIPIDHFLTNVCDFCISSSAKCFIKRETRRKFKNFLTAFCCMETFELNFFKFKKLINNYIIIAIISKGRFIKHSKLVSVVEEVEQLLFSSIKK